MDCTVSLGVIALCTITSLSYIDYTEVVSVSSLAVSGVHDGMRYGNCHTSDTEGHTCPDSSKCSVFESGRSSTGGLGVYSQLGDACCLSSWAPISYQIGGTVLAKYRNYR